MDLKSLSDEKLNRNLVELSKRDMAITAEIVAHIHEFMVRRLYLEHGCTNIFPFLTEKLGYSRATAQNRIDAARLLGDVPEICEDLASGKINLGDITLISMGVRQAEKESGSKVSPERKQELVEKLKNLKMESIKPNEHTSAQAIALELDIKIPVTEKVRVHQDGSVTIEVHLSKEEFENLKRVRDLSSHKLAHKNQGRNLADTIVEATGFYLEKKDPLKLKTKIVAPVRSSESHSSSTSNLSSESNSQSSGGAHPEPKVKSESDPDSIPNQKTGTSRKHISIHVKRAIHQRDQSCRWVDPISGERCESTHLLQVDHVIGLVNGGSNDVENLELKCAIHNRRKYELECDNSTPKTLF